MSDATRAEYEAYWKVFHAHQETHQLYDRANDLSRAQNRIVRAIRAVPAEGLFGLAVKLAALHEYEAAEVEDSAVAALGDINRILGTEFEIGGRTDFEEYGAWSDDDNEDEDDAEGDAKKPKPHTDATRGRHT